MGDSGREPAAQPGDTRAAALEEPRQRGPEQLGRALVVTCDDAVLDGVLEVPLLEEPVGGPAEDFPRRFRIELVAQGIPEQPVAPVPVLAPVEGDDEQIRPAQIVEDRGRPGALQHRVAQRPGQPLQHGRPHQQITVRSRQTLEHLGGEVVQDVPVVAPDGVEGRRRRRRSAQGDRGELQPGRPALGPLAQPVHRRVVQLDGPDGSHERSCLADREAQVLRPDLGQLAAGSQPGQRKRRVGAAGHDQAHRGRQVGQQELHTLVHPRVGQQVEVVEDEHDGVGGRLQLVEQQRHRDVDGVDPGCTQRRHRPGAQPVRPQRGHHVGPEPDRLVVGLVQRHPGNPTVLARVVRPLGQQRRLAPAGRGGDGGQPGRGVVQEEIVQPSTDDTARALRRDRAFRREKWTPPCLADQRLDHRLTPTRAVWAA